MLEAYGYGFDYGFGYGYGMEGYGYDLLSRLHGSLRDESNHSMADPYAG